MQYRVGTVYSCQKVIQLQKVKSLKYLTYLSLKNERQFQIVYNEVSTHWFCERPPLWISDSFSLFSLYSQNGLLTANWHLGLSLNCTLNYANTLPSGFISLVHLETYLCRSCARNSLAGDFFFFLKNTDRARFSRGLCPVSCMRRTDRTLNRIRPTNKLSTCTCFV